MTRLFMTVVASAALGLSACAPAPEPAEIEPEPVFYDKFGNPVDECEGSDEPGQQIPGTAPVPGQEDPCDPPDEDCDDPIFVTATGEYICPPEFEDNDPSRTPDSSNPTGAAGTPNPQ